MAYVKDIWFHQSGQKEKKMQVIIGMRPSGEARMDVDLPEKFYDTVMQAAQTAADHHEAQVRAEILGEQSKDKE